MSFTVTQQDTSSEPLLVCHFHWHLQIKHTASYIERVKCTPAAPGCAREYIVPEIRFSNDALTHIGNTHNVVWWDRNVTLAPSTTTIYHTHTQTRVTAAVKTPHAQEQSNVIQNNTNHTSSSSQHLSPPVWLAQMKCSTTSMFHHQECCSFAQNQSSQIYHSCWHTELLWSRIRGADTQ